MASNENQKTNVYLYKKYDYPSVNNENLDKLSIKPDGDQVLTIGSNLKLNLVKKDAMNCFKAKYLIVSKLTVLETGSINLCEQAYVDIELKPQHAPSSNFIVYYSDENKNVITQSFRIEIPNFYTNFVIFLFN